MSASVFSSTVADVDLQPANVFLLLFIVCLYPICGTQQSSAHLP